MTDQDWQPYAHRLAEIIAEAGDLHDPAWRAAIEATPRHLFIREFYEQLPDGGWETINERSFGWLAATYSNQPLSTALAELTDGQRVTVSSSTKPGLMVRMLEALEVREGHRVLEIGTGTGYNAALLAHRLGDAAVCSVDIGAELVTKARERLDRIGYQPELAAVDGAKGLPEHAPYDRILATCSVPAIPWAWAEQLTEQGAILVDLKRSTHAGNLVLLHKHADRLEGRFLPEWAGFMAIRHVDSVPEYLAVSEETESAIEQTTTTLDPLPWANLVPWLLAQSRLPDGLSFGYQGFGANGPEWASFTASDGSGANIALRADRDGNREVRQYGPTRLWDEYEGSVREWQRLGQPGWDRLGLTVWPSGAHTVWLDDPAGQQWQLAAE